MPPVNGHLGTNSNKQKPVFRAADLFVGAGGLSEGFKQAGFDICFANDFDHASSLTFGHSNPNVPFFNCPIQDLEPKILLKTAKLEKYELDVLSGGPPCQAFSVYNHQRGMHDERSGLFREYLKIVKGLMPRYVVMENVVGMMSLENGRAVHEIHESLGKLGYHVEHKILKAEEYGVPQFRRRIFIIGSRDDSDIEWPIQTHGEENEDLPLFNKKRKPFVRLIDAIGDLPPLNILEGTEIAEYVSAPLSAYQKALRKGSRELYNHVAPYLAPINQMRLPHIPAGGSWRDLPFDLLPAGMKRAKRSDHTKRYGRLEWDGLSSTILTKCDPHWGAYIHPDQQRTLTVREAARLQSFPDYIRFLGPRGEQYRQVGNAVPPLLGKAVALSVANMLKRVNPALNVANVY